MVWFTILKNNDMNELIETTKTAGEIYVTFVALLIFFNTFAKKVFWKPSLSVKKIVGVASAIMIAVFWFWGASMWKLLFFTFFAFGFYDWFGRYVEQLLDFLWFWIKQKIIKLVNTLKEKVKK